MQRPEISVSMRHKILELVRWHGFPLRFLQQQQPLDELKALGTRTDLRLLAIFGLFDFYGRDCVDKAEVLEQMHHFQSVFVPQVEYELGPFRSLLTAFGTWNLRHKNAVWNAFKMKDMRLLEKLVHAPQTDSPETRGQRATIVTGPPLAGKSTWIASERPDQFHIHLEEHGITNDLADNAYLLGRKLVEIKHLLRVYLNRHRHLVIETRPLVDAIRRPFVEILRDMPVELDLVVVEAALSQLRERNQTLSEPIPDTLLRSTYETMELLHPWEAHKISYVGQ